MADHILELAAQPIADTSKPPFFIGPDAARKVLDHVQAVPIDMPDVDEQWINVPADIGDVRVRIVKPVGGFWDGYLPEAFSVRYNGILHHFMVLNPVRSTAAIEQAIHILRKALGQ